MNVASLELCKELHELSGWGDTPISLLLNDFGDVADILRTGEENPYGKGYRFAPAYDLGYLLRKLPQYLDNHKRLNIHPTYDGSWWSGYSPVGDYDISDFAQIDQDTENAACKLAIELFKQGILKREGGQK